MVTLSAIAVSANSTKMEPLKSLLLRCRRNLTLFTWTQVEAREMVTYVCVGLYVDSIAGYKHS